MNSKKVTTVALQEKKRRGEPIAVVTAYDATMARLLDDAGVDALMVGDSVGMVVQGWSTTLSVTLEQMIYHCQCVARAQPRAHIIGDLPFLTYQVSDEEAVRSAGRLLSEGQAESVKLEGGRTVASAVRRIVDAGIPVMGHIGLTPQAVHQMGGFRVQGKSKESAQRLIDDAGALVEAGAYALVIEGVPADLGEELTKAVPIPTIGIGAGAATDGQVLVCYDLLGMYRGLSPKFVRRFAEVGGTITAAANAYVEAVRNRSFPAKEHTFSGAPPKDGDPEQPYGEKKETSQ